MTDDPRTQPLLVPAQSPEASRLAAAERALAEAAARRAEIDARVAALPPEHGARREREPVRYGDWETKGLASDF
jgi:hypothetical protein